MWQKCCWQRRIGTCSQCGSHLVSVFGVFWLFTIHTQCIFRCREPYVIFSGGMAYEKSGQTPTLTVIRGTSTTVLEMEHPVIDFVTVCSTPWNSGQSCALYCPALYCPLLYTVMHRSYSFVSSMCWIFLKIHSTSDPATAPSSVHISGNPVDVVESFIYLGSEIHSTGS